MNNRYLLICECGNILCKAKDLAIRFMGVEVKCAKCSRVVKIKEDTRIKEESYKA